MTEAMHYTVKQMEWNRGIQVIRLERNGAIENGMKTRLEWNHEEGVDGMEPNLRE